MKYKLLIFLFISYVFSNLSSAAEKQPEYSDLSLEELLHTPTQVTTESGGDRFTSPGVVTVITASEIQSMGVQDLMGVLLLVPGFDFGTDTQGSLGLAVRGNWAHEGKFLLLVDGIPMNENMFGTVVFGNRFPLNQISKIEIIRGPGSVIYGGSAEFAVINITTKNAQELDGIAFDAVYGQTEKDFSRRNLGVSYGKRFDDTDVSLHVFAGEGQASDKNLTDSNGAVIPMQSSSARNPLSVNLGISNSNWEFRSIFERYHMKDQSAYGTNLSAPVVMAFDSYAALLRYKTKLTENITIIPELFYQNQQPWKVTDPVGTEVTGVLYDKTEQRIKGKIHIQQNISSALNAIYGLEFYKDFSKDNLGTFQNGMKSVSYTNAALLAELRSKNYLFDIYAGLRYEYNSAYYSSIAPRIGLVRSYGDWNFKALYNRAFHTPVIENINTNAGIRPEKTGVAEVEISNKVSKDLFISVNFFNIHVDSPIVYNYSAADTYKNFGKTGTFGAEIETKGKFKLGTFALNYSYYKKGSDDVAFYQVPNNDTVHLAFPAHKITLHGSIPLSDRIYLSPAIMYFSNRVGYAYDATGGFQAKQFPSSVLANVSLNFRDLFTSNLNFSLGLMNVFNTDRPFLQPYTGGHGPIPNQSREYFLRLNYHMDL